MPRIVSLIIGYLMGMIRLSYVLGKKKGLDIRSAGSENAVGTNMLRTFGVKAGIIIIACDIIKTLVAMSISWSLFGSKDPQMSVVYAVYAGAGCVIGHCFPFYMGFRGGKGIAAMAGLIIGFHNLFLFLAGCLVFLGLFLITHYFSLASIMLCLALVVEVILLGEEIIFPDNVFATVPVPARYEVYILLFFLCVLAWVQHRGNISRLLRGKERRTYFSKEENQAETGRLK